MAAGDPVVEGAYLHVWVINSKVAGFYKRLGFFMGELVPNYYSNKLESPDAVLLWKGLGRTGLTRWQGTQLLRSQVAI